MREESQDKTEKITLKREKLSIRYAQQEVKTAGRVQKRENGVGWEEALEVLPACRSWEQLLFSVGPVHSHQLFV